MHTMQRSLRVLQILYYNEPHGRIGQRTLIIGLVLFPMPSTGFEGDLVRSLFLDTEKRATGALSPLPLRRSNIYHTPVTPVIYHYSKCCCCDGFFHRQWTAIQSSSTKLAHMTMAFCMTCILCMSDGIEESGLCSEPHHAPQQQQQ